MADALTTHYRDCCAGAYDVDDPRLGIAWTCPFCGRTWVYREGQSSVFATPTVDWWAERRAERAAREKAQLTELRTTRAAQRAAIPRPAPPTVTLAIADSTVETYDWEAETRGLAYMILSIDSRYRTLNLDTAAKLLPPRKRGLGGDSELLRSSVLQAETWVTGPLTAALDAANAAPLNTPGRDDLDWESQARVLATHILTIADCYRALILDHQGTPTQPSRRQRRSATRALRTAVLDASTQVNDHLSPALAKRDKARATTS